MLTDGGEKRFQDQSMTELISQIEEFGSFLIINLLRVMQFILPNELTGIKCWASRPSNAIEDFTPQCISNL